MNMVTTYQDDNNEYFLTEFIRGIELFDVIREIGNFLHEKFNIVKRAVEFGLSQILHWFSDSLH